MGKYDKYRNITNKNRKIVKIRILAVAAMLILYLIKDPFAESSWEETVWKDVTSGILPLLTYNVENGNPDAGYMARYEVPDWFYEDENASESTEKEEGQPEALEVITTPATGGQEKGIAYTREQLEKTDFLLNHIFLVDGNTSLTAEEVDLSNLLTQQIQMSDFVCENLEEVSEAPPKVLIYHTHGSESFADSRPGVQEDTIIGVGEYLTEILEKQYGISVYHDETLYDVVDGKLDRSKAYEKAYEGVSKILQENSSIEVVIDLHRDGVDEETHLVTTINQKSTAKIMFLNGVSRSNLNGEITYLENPNKKLNLAFSFQMYLVGKEKYGDYVRKIYVRSLRYNLHLMPRTTLIEVGAQNNTLEEEKNAMEPLADILYEVLKGNVSF